MTVIWLVAIGVLVIVELLTYGLYFAALAIAVLVPLALSLFDAPVWLQAFGFLAASALALIYVRPLIRRWQGDKPERMTNVMSLIGKQGTVIEPVSDQAGLIKIWGEEWTARSKTTIPKGKKVLVEGIDGVSLMVSEHV